MIASIPRKHSTKTRTIPSIIGSGFFLRIATGVGCYHSFPLFLTSVIMSKYRLTYASNLIVSDSWLDTKWGSQGCMLWRRKGTKWRHSGNTVWFVYWRNDNVLCWKLYIPRNVFSLSYEELKKKKNINVISFNMKNSSKRNRPR